EDNSNEVTWSSSNPVIATVSDAAGTSGRVNAMAVGTATITASIGGLSSSTQVTVTAPALSSAPPVTVPSGHAEGNNRHLVEQIRIDFSGPVNASEAENMGMYRLTMTGRNDSFIAKNATVVKLKSATYDAALDEVILTLKRPFRLSNCVQVVIDGHQPGG